MRTQEEILQRFNNRKNDDMLGFEVNVYLSYLDYDHVKPFLKEGTTEVGWTPNPTDKESIKKQMIDYLEFAWGKANNCRGISANRSIMHYQAWFWMIGEDEIADHLMDDYKYYGKPQLETICEYLGVDHKQWDDGIR